jgi:DNA-binding transcriptional ArsR family regulator
MSRNASSVDVFHAVADPTRRRILDLLVESDKAVSDLVAAFKISQPSISEHLRILREAGLVVARKLGRRRIYRITPMYLQEITSWIATYHRFWDRRLDALGEHLERADLNTPTIHSQMTMEID